MSVSKLATDGNGTRPTLSDLRRKVAGHHSSKGEADEKERRKETLERIRRERRLRMKAMSEQVADRTRGLRVENEEQVETAERDLESRLRFEMEQDLERLEIELIGKEEERLRQESKLR